MRTYELMFISDPRVPDEDVVAMTDEIKGMLTANGGEVIRVEQWGRRRLAYEIDKLKEGKYTLFYLAGEDGQIPIAEVEMRMRQNDRIVRYLTVRTDLDLKRAGLPHPTEFGPETPGAEGETPTEGGATPTTGGTATSGATATSGGTATTTTGATPAAASGETPAASGARPAAGEAEAEATESGATTTEPGATAAEPEPEAEKE